MGYKKCEFKDCPATARFNFEGQRSGKFCGKHKKANMINLAIRLCGHAGCKLAANFNMHGEIVGKFCSNHKLQDMVNVCGRKCLDENCYKEPVFGNPGDKQRLFCNDHKEDGMISIQLTQCTIEDCQDNAYYNTSGKTVRLYCHKHKSPDMVNLTTLTKKCQYPECKTYPSFNIPSIIKPAFCARHKSDEMIDVRGRICEHEGCNTTPYFNFPKEKQGKFCFDHKSPEMINVKSKSCIHEDCPIRPVFNNPGIKPGIYCAEHKGEGMVNVKDPVCQHAAGCSTAPRFNYIGEIKTKFCSKHQLSNMVNVRTYKITSCISQDCNNLPLFNFEKRRAIYCDYHKQEGMKNLEISKKCCTSDCLILPIASLNGRYYCSVHYPDQSAISKSNRKCSICDLAPNDYICADCKNQRHLKEWEVVCHLKRKIHKSPILDSNRPVSECSRRRPDVYYDCGTHVVIVEVDEDKHRYYKPECECARMNQIVSSLGGLPITFVRYNPDEVVNNGKKMEIPKSDRLELLIKIVNTEIEIHPDLFRVKLIQLYYDDNYEIYEEVKTEDITDIVAC